MLRFSLNFASRLGVFSKQILPTSAARHNFARYHAAASFSTGPNATPDIALTSTPASSPPTTCAPSGPLDVVPDTLVVDPTVERTLKILQLEVDVLRQEGRKVPAALKPDQWEHLMSLKSKSARTKYYTFLWTVEKKRENEKLRRAEKREAGVELRAERIREREAEKHIVYALSGTSYFMRIYETTMNHWHNNKLMRAMQFGQKLVLDCSYDEHMTKRECILAAKQLMLVFAENRIHDQPFDLHFCNANMAGHTLDYLQRHIPTMLNAEFPLNVHTDSYLDHFPHEQLVYLTPHCKNDLTEYDPDKVYIIGAMVDTMHNEPLSLAKAKKHGLQMARLPLDRYLQWGAGSGKSLTLNQMTRIMLDLKTSGDWNKSLSHVPRRKLVLDRSAESVERAERQQWNKNTNRLTMGGSGGDRTEWTDKRKTSSRQWTSTMHPAETNAPDGTRINRFRRKTES